MKYIGRNIIGRNIAADEPNVAEKGGASGASRWSELVVLLYNFSPALS